LFGVRTRFCLVILGRRPPQEDPHPMVNTTPVWDMITIPPAPPIY